MTNTSKKQEIINLISQIKDDQDLRKEVLSLVIEVLDLRNNKLHPLVFINGQPKIGENVYIGLFSEINAKESEVIIGNNCDIASFVSINVADSHKKCIEFTDNIERNSIVLEDNVFVGSHSFIGGDVHIGHHSVVASGTILINSGYIPPYSLIVGNPVNIKKEYYVKQENNTK